MLFCVSHTTRIRFLHLDLNENSISLWCGTIAYVICIQIFILVWSNPLRPAQTSKRGYSPPSLISRFSNPQFWPASNQLQLSQYKRKAQCLNDYRPVALTQIITKCFERLILSHIKASIPADLDQHQFAYRANRSTEDAVITALHTALTHLDRGNTYSM